MTRELTILRMYGKVVVEVDLTGTTSTKDRMGVALPSATFSPSRLGVHFPYGSPFIGCEPWYPNQS